MKIEVVHRRRLPSDCAGQVEGRREILNKEGVPGAQCPYTSSFRQPGHRALDALSGFPSPLTLDVTRRCGSGAKDDSDNDGYIGVMIRQGTSLIEIGASL